jgi:hypothetical protein
VFNVRLEATGNNGLPNIDYLEVSGGTAANCTASIANANAKTITATNVASDKELSLYPNPASNTIKVMLPSYWKAGDNLTIFDAAGKQVLNKQLAGNVDEVDISSLQAGTYFIRVSNKGSKMATQTFIKKAASL